VLQKALLDAGRQPTATTCFHATYQAFIRLPMPAPWKSTGFAHNPGLKGEYHSRIAK